MKFERTAKGFFNYKKQYQLPFMKRIAVKCSDPRTLETYNFVWNINIFKTSTIIVFKKCFMFYLRNLRKRIFPQKGLLCFFKLIYDVSWDGCKIIFDNTDVLKITIFTSTARFLISVLSVLIEHLLQLCERFFFLFSVSL